MNKAFVFLFFALFLGVLPSYAKNELHVFLPGLQYRYEDNQDQIRKNQRYDNYNIAGIIYDDYLVGIEYNQFKQESGNASLNVNYKFQEINLYAGYFFYSKLLNSENSIVLDVGPAIYLGQNKIIADTYLAGNSVRNQGENNLAVAASMQGTLRIKFVLIQADIRYAYSRVYQPSYTPIYGARIGFRIEL